ncbi:MAG: SUMF1/EgtB/PvdO family nonheme iron enzyme [Saprospiraceae bacterium]
MKKSHFIFLILTLFAASCSVYKSYFRAAKRANFQIAGQTAPPDMVFIQGNTEMESFYMSATEEPNINYAIYLKWLNAIYSESYPEVSLEAYPKQLENDKFLTYNDPYLQSYLTHPAYAYYPVTGLNWSQIQKYLAWKTDRLNEMILVKEGILNWNPDQQDEDNFNTEAYLISQYEGNVRKNLPDTSANSRGERPVRFSDGILFTGFRLPTETEWEYANAIQNKSSGAVTYNGKKHPYHPYGDDYYTLAWNDAFYYRSYGYPSRHSDIYYAYFANSKQFENVNYKLPDAIKYNKDQQRMGNIPADYGLINMEGGAREWLIDTYEETYEPESDWKAVYQKSGYDVGSEVGVRISEEEFLKYKYNGYYNYTRHVEKDSLGHLKYFRYIGTDENGQPLEVGITPERHLKWNSKINAYRNKYNNNRTYEGEQEFYKNYRKLRNQLEQKNVYRVIKGGTWQQPSQARTAMRGDSAAVDVGFRCVLPYTGLPVRKGYKIKW